MMPEKQGGELELVSSEKHLPVNDPLRTAATLNELASDFRKTGYDVERGFLGTVVLKLQDGQVHLVPGNGGIFRYIFKLKDCKNEEIPKRRVLLEKKRCQSFCTVSS